MFSSFELNSVDELSDQALVQDMVRRLLPALKWNFGLLAAIIFVALTEAAAPLAGLFMLGWFGTYVWMTFRAYAVVENRWGTSWVVWLTGFLGLHWLIIPLVAFLGWQEAQN